MPQGQHASIDGAVDRLLPEARCGFTLSDVPRRFHIEKAKTMLWAIDRTTVLLCLDGMPDLLLPDARSTGLMNLLSFRQ